MRIGIGYDIHRLVPERKLILGGVEIPSIRGLLGYSDADVLLHALCDAMLGGLGLGDIGEHFPNTDPQYKDISSIVLLKKVSELVKEKSYSVNNIDITVIAEEPQLKPFKEKMKQNIARTLGMNTEDLNIKATTNEGVGYIGKAEAIAAYAVVTLKPLK
ncbi:MAG: 2-C-methyl-D-erythritol 2,4-cyclodiphosphate synthase [Candidatus Omnitrophica bacterium CG07_land_8_20_14_0_80_42_15]|uniref:2-C-methyl-D-erythritol 2,4-cyclodiphosphate synthase n=1 Tax=Candidatus Aquitaenariimonas noxiae TaxID=1974741 RepID=A0A2J0KUP4_9BACT|nr:MAG: 2-C-methyl-D-erythritol 2,4-cyclodiphosphate synthase [Candidatus Omnitrophica bacterium CG07_land_8_20_14_0_80_42_15]